MHPFVTPTLHVPPFDPARFARVSRGVSREGVRIAEESLRSDEFGRRKLWTLVADRTVSWRAHQNAKLATQAPAAEARQIVLRYYDAIDVELLLADAARVPNHYRELRDELMFACVEQLSPIETCLKLGLADGKRVDATLRLPDQWSDVIILAVEQGKLPRLFSLLVSFMAQKVKNLPENAYDELVEALTGPTCC